MTPNPKFTGASDADLLAELLRRNDAERCTHVVDFFETEITFGKSGMAVIGLTGTDKQALDIAVGVHSQPGE